MRVLAVDTSTSFGSVALVEGADVVGEMRFRAKAGHSTLLMPAIARLLATIDLEPDDVDGFAVVLGPGSYTGLRVGIATVQGLAIAAQKPCFGASTLDVLAERIRGSAPVLATMVDAYRGEVYAASYDAGARRLSGPTIAVAAEYVRPLPPSAAVVGDGVDRHRDAIAAARPDVLLSPRSLYLAGTLGRLGGEGLASGAGVEASQLHPLYIRGIEYRRVGT